MANALRAVALLVAFRAAATAFAPNLRDSLASLRKLRDELQSDADAPRLDGHQTHRIVVRVLDILDGLELDRLAARLKGVEARLDRLEGVAPEEPEHVPDHATRMMQTITYATKLDLDTAVRALQKLMAGNQTLSQAIAKSMDQVVINSLKSNISQVNLFIRGNATALQTSINTVSSGLATANREMGLLSDQLIKFATQVTEVSAGLTSGLDAARADFESQLSTSLDSVREASEANIGLLQEQIDSLNAAADCCESVRADLLEIIAQNVTDLAQRQDSDLESVNNALAVHAAAVAAKLSESEALTQRWVSDNIDNVNQVLATLTSAIFELDGKVQALTERHDAFETLVDTVARQTIDYVDARDALLWAAVGQSPPAAA